MNQTPKLEHISPADLIPHARNAKLHNRAQLEQIADSIKQFGFLAPVLIDQDNGIIAAEQLGRKCYGMEISPAYCDVIVKRWETLTGKKATRSADVL